MSNHVNAVCKSIHYHIRSLRHIRSSISEDMAKMVACALVGSRLDYANGLITIAIRARFDYDSATIRLQHATTRYEVFRSLAYDIVYDNQW